MSARVVALVISVVGFAGASYPAAAADARQPPTASLSRFLCRPASNSLNRVTGITSTMRPMAGTQTMRLRFVLLERTPGHMFHPVRGGDLGRWHQAPSETWVVRKLVVNLPAPAVYRFRVSFLWLGSSGAVLGTRTLVSPTCTQPKYPRPAARLGL